MRPAAPGAAGTRLKPPPISGHLQGRSGHNGELAAQGAATQSSHRGYGWASGGGMAHWLGKRQESPGQIKHPPDQYLARTLTSCANRIVPTIAHCCLPARLGRAGQYDVASPWRTARSGAARAGSDFWWWIAMQPPQLDRLRTYADGRFAGHAAGLPDGTSSRRPCCRAALSRC